MQRVLRLAAVGLACGVLAAVLEFAFANPQSGCGINFYDPSGCTPLRTAILMPIVVFPILGAIIGMLLPLYRYRFGGAAIGVVTFLGFIGVLRDVAIVLRLRGTGNPPERWQTIVLFALGVVVSATMGHQARWMALGEEPPADEGDSGHTISGGIP